LYAFIEENSLEISKTGIERRIREHLINLQSSFSKYFPEKMNDKYSWIRGPFHEVSPSNDFSLEEEENYIDLTSDTFLKLRFRRESLTERFGWALEKNTPTPARKLLTSSFRNLLFVRDWIFRSGSLKTKYRSMLNIESDLRMAISRLQPQYEKLCCKKQPHPSH
jgi:hypothetical protein